MQSTTDICSTCVTAACVVEATVTAGCGCPETPVTIYHSYPCELGCDALTACGTFYKVVTATDCELSLFLSRCATQCGRISLVGWGLCLGDGRGTASAGASESSETDGEGILFCGCELLKGLDAVLWGKLAVK